MWIKSFDDLKGCFTEDGNFHSVYIVNDDLYIDGVKIYTGNIGKIKVFSHALSDDEVSAEYQTAQHSVHLTCATCGAANAYEYDEELVGEVCVRCGTRR